MRKLTVRFINFGCWYVEACIWFSSILLRRGYCTVIVVFVCVASETLHDVGNGTVIVFFCVCVDCATLYDDNCVYCDESQCNHCNYGYALVDGATCIREYLYQAEVGHY